MRSAASMFALALASCIDRSHSATMTTFTSTSTTLIRGDMRHYADALEDLERAMTEKVGRGGRGDGGDGVEGGGRHSRSSRKPTSKSATTPGSTIHRHRRYSLNGVVHNARWELHDQPWGEGKIEEVRASSQRAVDDNNDGGDSMDKDDELALLSRRMADIDGGRMRSVYDEPEDRVSEWNIPSPNGMSTFSNIFSCAFLFPSRPRSLPTMFRFIVGREVAMARTGTDRSIRTKETRTRRGGVQQEEEEGECQSRVMIEGVCLNGKEENFV
jgi:hypothetical protein